MRLHPRAHVAQVTQMHMPDKEKGPPVVPLANLAVLVAVLGGVVLYRAALTSSRPAIEPGHDGLAWGRQDVGARLWQDPLEVSGKHEEELQLRMDKGGYADGAEVAAHDIGAVVEHLASVCDGRDGEASRCGGGGRPKILGVMVRAGLYEELVERRLRTRHAVTEGLAASGFTPADSLHVGYFKVEWPARIDDLPPHDDGPTLPLTDSRSLLVPYEWYESKRLESKAPRALLVLWLRDDAFGDAPLSRLASLVWQLEGGPSPERRALHRLRVAIIGPATSGGSAGNAGRSPAEGTARPAAPPEACPRLLGVRHCARRAALRVQGRSRRHVPHE